jgi:putative nucleotidyltransferase with HDIG domain
MCKDNVIDLQSVREKNVINISRYFDYAKCAQIPEAETHSRRVSELCAAMGIAMGLPEPEVNKLRISGLLHDIGKNSIDQRVINKQDQLTEQEWDLIKKHPIIGYRILNSSPKMNEIAKYVLHHHERFDGLGYPIGLAGEKIPLVSRIIAVADAYDAMTNERSYRKTLNKHEAVQELINNKGKQFDPNIVDIFIEKVLHCR